VIRLAEDDQNLEGEAVEASVPEWVPEKFRSNPEEFASAYTNLEKEFHARNQQLKAQEASINELSAQFEALTQQQQQPTYDPNQDPYVAQFEQAMDQGDWRTAMAIQDQRNVAIAQQTAQQIVQQQQGQQPNYQALVGAQARQAIEAKYPDFEEYREDVIERITENGWIANPEVMNDPAKLTAVFETGYKLAKADKLFEAGITTADQQAEASRQMKLNAQTASGAGGRPASEGPSLWDEIASATTTKLGL
jgi:hypothetical protein